MHTGLVHKTKAPGNAITHGNTMSSHNINKALHQAQAALSSGCNSECLLNVQCTECSVDKFRGGGVTGIKGRDSE